MDESERYTEICKPAFDEIKEDTSKILRILEGANGAPGLCERVRANEKFRKYILGVVSAVFLIVAGQLIAAIVEWISH